MLEHRVKDRRPSGEDRLMNVERAIPVDDQRTVGEPFVPKKVAEVLRQTALGHGELRDRRLAGNVDGVGDDAHFAEQGQFVFGQ